MNQGVVGNFREESRAALVSTLGEAKGRNLHQGGTAGQEERCQRICENAKIKFIVYFFFFFFLPKVTLRPLKVHYPPFT